MLFAMGIHAQNIELLADTNPGDQGGDFFSPLRFGDEIIFGNISPTNVFELWISDGTAAGTDLIFEDINGQLDVSTSLPYFKNGNLLFFYGFNSSTEMHIYNILSGELHTILPEGYAFFRANNFFPFNDKVVFTAESDVYGKEYYITDGTAEGTSLLKDIAEGQANVLPNNSAHPDYFTFGDKLVFQADDGIHGLELWITDGTTAGTQLLKDLDNSPGNSESVYILGGLDSYFFFEYKNGNTDFELWISDGTTEGTQVFKDVLGVDELADPGLFGVLNNKFLFTTTSAEGQKLWETDGSQSGTNIIYNFGSSEYSIGLLANREDYLVFSLIDFNDTWQHVWRTDGTEQGTFNLFSAPWNPFIAGLTPFVDLGEKVILKGIGLFSYSLWATDGTVAGTEEITEVSVVNPFSGGFYREYVGIEESIMDGKAYFIGNTEGTGNELWQTDGTIAGTFMVEDFVVGEEGLHPAGIISLDDRVLFYGTNPEFGRELHRLVVEPNSTEQNQKLDPSLLLYPNPTAGLFRVEWRDKDSFYKGEILDAQGRVVWSKTSLSSGEYQEVDLEAGVYILVLSNERSYHSRKLIIN